MAETSVFGTEARACQRCKGTGTVTYAGFTTAEGTVYPEVSRTCLDCDGGGTWPVPDLGDILRRITAHKGKGKGRMRASMSSFDRTDRSVARKYAYYVWRWARFHGGADVTMPVMADKSMCGPWEKELDTVADAVARRTFGTGHAGALRWANALGYSVPVPTGMPASAFAGGPVHDGQDGETNLLLEMERRELEREGAVE